MQRYFHQTTDGLAQPHLATKRCVQLVSVRETVTSLADLMDGLATVVVPQVMGARLGAWRGLNG
eukprot:3452027-Prorocentrum_lima.AAC.1